MNSDTRLGINETVRIEKLAFAALRFLTLACAWVPKRRQKKTLDSFESKRALRFKKRKEKKEMVATKNLLV